MKNGPIGTPNAGATRPMRKEIGKFSGFLDGEERDLSYKQQPVQPRKAEPAPRSITIKTVVSGQTKQRG